MIDCMNYEKNTDLLKILLKKYHYLIIIENMFYTGTPIRTNINVEIYKKV